MVFSVGFGQNYFESDLMFQSTGCIVPLMCSQISTIQCNAPIEISSSRQKYHLLFLLLYFTSQDNKNFVSVIYPWEEKLDKNLGTIPSGKFAVHTQLFSKISREISNTSKTGAESDLTGTSRKESTTYNKDLNQLKWIDL